MKKMNRQEAEAYIRLVHNTVNGKHIKIESNNFKGVTKYLKDSFEHAQTDVKMPDYNHAKYLLAMKIISIHGDDTKELIASFKEVYNTAKNSIMRLF